MNHNFSSLFRYAPATVKYLLIDIYNKLFRKTSDKLLTIQVSKFTIQSKTWTLKSTNFSTPNKKTKGGYRIFDTNPTYWMYIQNFDTDIHFQLSDAFGFTQSVQSSKCAGVSFFHLRNCNWRLRTGRMLIFADEKWHSFHWEKKREKRSLANAQVTFDLCSTFFFRTDCDNSFENMCVKWFKSIRICTFFVWFSMKENTICVIVD